MCEVEWLAAAGGFESLCSGYYPGAVAEVRPWCAAHKSCLGVNGFEKEHIQHGFEQRRSDQQGTAMNFLFFVRRGGRASRVWHTGNRNERTIRGRREGEWSGMSCCGSRVRVRGREREGRNARLRNSKVTVHHIYQFGVIILGLLGN
jgi:hypothetical protein